MRVTRSINEAGNIGKLSTLPTFYQAAHHWVSSLGQSDYRAYENALRQLQVAPIEGSAATFPLVDHKPGSSDGSSCKF